ncbi:hypothetical protein BLNAU_7105 [Blattamonas nauphoetae]|uniref:Uncharacterized protein n=1 Tax=Blattamonas nauphoetae TaxID=2049346 RepID=A0ABQ9Y2G5_9EUKA|nr:hypothetical protein BLNAU_7105 [Blattamonas nauphoetae]
MDCSPFVNWDEEELESPEEWAIVFRSLVATLKLQPALDDSLEAKAIELLESVHPASRPSANAFLNSFASNSGDSTTEFVQYIGVLISSPSQTITTTAMGILISQILSCSAERKLHLVKADLIHQLIISLNPQSLSFTEAVDIHINLMKTIRLSLRLATPDILEDLGIEDGYEEQAVHEIVLKQVLAPSKQYMCHLCVNRYSIIDRDLLRKLVLLLTRIIRICPFYQHTMDFVLSVPVFLTIPSCLTFFEDDWTITRFQYILNNSQREWNEHGRDLRQMWKTVLRMLRMEGFSDVIEEKLQNDRTESLGGWIVIRSIEWSNLQGMNLSEQE